MTSDNRTSIVWGRLRTQPLTLRYADEDVLLDPQAILQDELSRIEIPSTLEDASEPTRTEKEPPRRTLTLKELRRKFWHFRNRAKTALRRRLEDDVAPKAAVSQVNLPSTPSLSKSEVAQLFDPQLQVSLLEDKIDELQTRVEAAKASNQEIFELLHSFYKAGDLTAATALLQQHGDELTDYEPANSLINRIRDDVGLQNFLPEIPSRGDGPIVVPEKGRILYCAASTIHYHSNGYATRTAGLVAGLKEAGADVVVAARPGYPWDVRTHRSREKNIFHVKQAGGVEYAYSFGPSLKSQTLSKYLEHAVDSYLRLIERYRPSRVHAASNHTTALPALIAARIAGLQFTYEVRGFWEYALQGRPGKPNERRALATRLEDLVLKNADHIFILSPEMKAELKARGYDDRSITVLPNGVNTDVFQPLPKVGDLVEKYQLNDGKFNIGYAGSMVAYEGLDVLLDAAIELSHERNDFRLVFVGDGPVLPGIKQKIADTTAPLEVKFLGRVAPALMPNIVSTFDLTIAPRKSTEVTRLVSPLKPLESMAAGVPFIASDLPVLRGLVEESRSGALFQTSDSASLATEIRKLLDNPNKLHEMGLEGRRWTVQNRQWSVLARDLLEKMGHVHTNSVPGSKRLSDITIGLIADEFTTVSLRDTVKLVILDRSRWFQQLQSVKIDALFVESAWKGNSSQWIRGIGHYSDTESQDLENLLTFCRDSNIPTIFWNKEDPVHFERFKRNAMLFDVVLSTDNRSISRYQELQTHPRQKFGSLPFFATPRTHHPVRSGEAGGAQVVYAGSYYGERYPERSKSLLELLEGAKSFELSIFDRQLDNPTSPYKFPLELQPYVVGGLKYHEMLDAYRHYPIHLNVNSVSRSETMFSRRVVEIGMAGGLVMSSPSVAMSMLFSGMVPQVNSAQVARELLAQAVASPEIRNVHGWNLRRLMRRSHSINTRLISVLRRVGLNIKGLTVPKILVQLSPEADTCDYESLINMSLPHHSLAVTGEALTDTAIKDELNANGIEVLSSVHDTSGFDYVFHWNGTFLDPEILEDSIFLAEDMQAAVVSVDTKRPASIYDPLASVSTGVGTGASHLRYTGPETGRALTLTLHRGMIDRQSTHNATQLTRTQEDDPEDLAQQLTGKQILVAGHDLKFVTPFIQALRSYGLQVNVDKWVSHNSHDVERSRELLDIADVIFCEWGLGNAVWYSENLRDNQRLVVRVHSQELFRNYLSRLRAEKVDEIVYVSPHIHDAAQGFGNVRKIKSRIVPNIVRNYTSSVTMRSENRFTIGVVGIVPQQKGLDKALDLLENLRERDERFTLRIKGNLPEDYPWMASRENEMLYYEKQYARIQTSSLLRDAVQFDGFSAEWHEMEEWYRSVGVVISVSEFESFHFTLVDGPIHGALPVSLRWPGADRIYPEEWLANNINEMSDLILTKTSRPDVWSDAVHNADIFVRDKFNPNRTFIELLRTLTYSEPAELYEGP